MITKMMTIFMMSINDEYKVVNINDDDQVDDDHDNRNDRDDHDVNDLHKNPIRVPP